MKQSRASIFLLCVLLFFSGCAGKEEAPRTYKDYNVVFIAFDGLQAKHLNYYGYPLNSTPNLDEFLDESYVFENAVSPASWTVPSYMSVFASMYPSEHKLVNKFSGYDNASKQYIKSDFTKLSPDAVTLAWILKQKGYKTAAFTGDAGFSGGFGYSKGFDEYYDAVMFGGLDYSMPKAIDWLRKNKGEKFFLVLHGYDVHGQYAPAEGYDYRYVEGLYTGKYTGSKEEQGALREEGLANGRLNLSEEDLRFWRAVYDEKINRVDEKFSVFMKEAEDLGLMENTLFVVFSDHGTEFYEHKAFDHGHTLYGELIDVLYAIRLPGQKEGKRIDSLVSTMDTMPTVLRLLGIDNPVPAQTRGIDLTPSFSGADVSRNQFSETDYRLYTHKRSVQTPEGWKLIVTYPGKEKELYNLKADPLETNNLAEKEAEITEELSKIIEQHLIDMNATGPWTLGCVPVYNDQCQAPPPSAPDLKKKP